MRTYRGRTPQEQMEYNKQRREKLQRVVKDIVPDNPEDETTEIDVSAIPNVPKQSLKERVLQGMQKNNADKKPKPVVDKKTSDKNLQFFRQVLPLTFSGLFAMYAKQLIKDPYKPCTPDREEIASILLPIFNMISRYIEVSGEMSQNALDIGSAIIASFTVGARITITALEIRNHVRQHTTNDSQYEASYTANGSNPGTTGTTGTSEPDYTNEMFRATRYMHDNGTTNGNTKQSNVAASVQYADNGDSDDRTWEVKQVADLLRRDTIGRRQMGLAPRGIPTND